MENEFEKSYSAYNGTKLEYATTSDTETFTRIYGLRSVPDVGGEPSEISTTDLDNLEFETAIYHLKPAQKYNFEFNMEQPNAEANIKIASDLEDSGLNYFWKLTYANGIVVTFESKVKTTLLGGSSGDLIGFTMHLAPKGEPQRTIPTEM